jgi:hypothetical protein
VPGWIFKENSGCLTAAARYDASCASSGSQRSGAGVGNTSVSGICHSWSEDGRCISLLKILMTNHCIFDCAYCANRRSNDVPRASFTPEEVVKLTVEFYKRNYIEGLYSELRHLAQSAGHHGAHAGHRADIAARRKLPRLHPPQGHPRRTARPAASGGGTGGPAEREYRTAL